MISGIVRGAPVNFHSRYPVRTTAPKIRASVNNRGIHPKANSAEQRQWPGLATHDRDCDAEDGGGSSSWPEELSEAVFVSLLITGLRLG